MFSRLSSSKFPLYRGRLMFPSAAYLSVDLKKQIKELEKEIEYLKTSNYNTTIEAGMWKGRYNQLKDKEAAENVGATMGILITFSVLYFLVSK